MGNCIKCWNFAEHIDCTSRRSGSNPNSNRGRNRRAKENKYN